MKKSFSVLLSAALAFGSFASLTSAAELTAKEKFDALKAKGIFTGVNAAGDAGLDQNMNRAQFARVAALILGLEGIGNPDTLKVTEKPFPDVDLGKWYTEEVAAVKAAKVLVGNADGTFNPEGNISVQELAVVTANLLGLKAVEGAKVDGAADWAAGYIKAILDAGVSFPTNYTEAATRGQLVELSFQADAKLNPVAPAKVSVASAKATGVKTVEVMLDKAVDTDKATVTLKKGAATVATTAKWSDDKKTATLTLTSAKISAGTYTVTLGGIDAADVAKASSEFTAEDETVKSIEWVTATDKIAYSTKAKVKLNPLNQYGETASFNASSYVVSATNLTASLKKDTDGKLIATINTTSGGLTQGSSQIPVIVYFDNNRANAQKTFTLGTVPFATSMKLGDVKYSNGKDVLSVEGEVATVPMDVLDQFGNPLTPEQNANVNINAFVTPYNQALTYDTTDTSGDQYKVKVSINTNNDVTKAIEKAANYTLTVLAGSATATKEIKVGPAKIAMSVKVGEADLLAAGDTNKYVSLDVYDADGNALTPQEIADNASRINVSVSGATATNAIVRTGKNKGKIKIDSVPNSPNGYVFVSANIATLNANSHDNKQFKIEAARIPDSIAIDTSPAVKAVLGATSDFKLLVKDQYGAELKTPAVGITWASNYKTEVRLVNAGVTSTVSLDNDATDGKETTIAGGGAWAQIGANNDFTYFNRTGTFNTVSADRGTARLEAQLVRTSDGAIVSTQYVSIESIAPTTSLFYSLEDLGTIFGTKDAPAAYNVSALDQTTDGVFSKEVKLVVKDAAGNKVAVPSSVGLKALYASNVNVVSVTDSVYSPAVNKIVGQKAGAASVTATVYAVDGTTKSLTKDVTVKADPITVTEINGNDEITLGAVRNFSGAGNILAKVDLKVKTNYGNEFAQLAYNHITGVSVSISDVVTNDTNLGSVIINYAPGAAANSSPDSLTISGNVIGFTLNITSADGKIVKSVQVTV